MLYYTILPVVIGFVMDAIFGDPHNMPHPVRIIGKMTSALEKILYGKAQNEKSQFISGAVLAIIVIIAWTVLPAVILIASYGFDICIGVIIHGVMCYYLIAAKCLKTESMKVYNAVKKNDLEGARSAVSMIVGRDTKSLDREGIIKAAVETVAENTSDGVTAPVFYAILGTATAGFAYKAVNTMDSMIGYRNDKYMYFGRFAARLDDVLNYIPARLTAVTMVAASFILRYDWKNALKIWKRDRRKHKSPNAAQTESACAGALDIRLAGDAYYFGKLVKKDTLGDDIKPVENGDIYRANRLMYITSILMTAFIAAVAYLIYDVCL